MECLLNPGEFKDAVSHHSNGHENTEVYLQYLDYKNMRSVLGYFHYSFEAWKTFGYYRRELIMYNLQRAFDDVENF